MRAFTLLVRAVIAYSRSTLEADVQARMDDYLKSHGYDSLEALSEHVEGILEGDTLAHWRSLRDSCAKIRDCLFGQV